MPLNASHVAGDTGHVADHNTIAAFVNTHDDVDTAMTAHHHTLGAGADQAAAGNHTHGPGWMGSFHLMAQSSAVAWFTNNGAAYYRFIAPSAVTLPGLQIVVVTASGNIDVGVYADSSGSPAGRLASSGSVACPAAGPQIVSFTGSINLVAGTTYWFAMACSTTAATFAGNTLASASMLQAPTGGKASAFEQATALPLPASATPAAYAVSSAFLIGYKN